MKSERCDCLRIKEGCSKLCACKQICKNKEPTKKVTKVSKPTQGCQCAKSKKQCVKKECPCRGLYEFCSSSCKCSGDCTNGPSKFHVPKHVQNTFLEHKHESSGLIVTLIGEDYIYRGDFYHESKSEPHVEEQLVAAIYDLISKYNVSATFAYENYSLSFRLICMKLLFLFPKVLASIKIAIRNAKSLMSVKAIKPVRSCLGYYFLRSEKS